MVATWRDVSMGKYALAAVDIPRGIPIGIAEGRQSARAWVGIRVAIAGFRQS
jgi:hypothetical protein